MVLDYLDAIPMGAFHDFGDAGIDLWPPWLERPAEVGTAEGDDVGDALGGIARHLLVHVLLREMENLGCVVPEPGELGAPWGRDYLFICHLCNVIYTRFRFRRFGSGLR